MDILSRVEQPWVCRREEPEQAHHQVHIVMADPCNDATAEDYAQDYADQLGEPVYIHYWNNATTWRQTYAVAVPETIADADDDQPATSTAAWTGIGHGD